MKANSSTKQSGVVTITIIYLLIALSGWLSWYFIPIKNEVIAFLVADIVMTIVCFSFSMFYKNSSVYDAYWSVIPFYFVVFWSYLFSQQLTIFHLISFLIVSIWSWRLTLNWVRSWAGIHHEDWRYVDLARKTGVFYPAVSFLGIHLFPTILVFAGMWPLYYSFYNTLDSEILFCIGSLISFIGIWFEYSADNELAKFKRRPNPQKGEILDSGLWSKSQNPNYFGEILFWIGIGIAGISFSAPYYTLSGALAMILLFNFISIPLKEERMISRRKNYGSYQKRVSRLIPNPFR